MTMTLYSFALQPNPEILGLRATIFNHLIELYENYQKHVFFVFENYINTYHRISPDEIFSNDAVSIMGFIQDYLTPQNYIHNIFVNNYLDFLENHNVAFDSNLREKFKNDTFLVYRLLIENRKELIQYKYEEYQLIRKERFTFYFAGFRNVSMI